MRSRHTRDIARAGGAAARGVSRTVHGIHTQIADVTGAGVRRAVGPAADPVLALTRMFTDGAYAAVGAGLAGTSAAAGHLAGAVAARRHPSAAGSGTLDHSWGQHIAAAANASHGDWLDRHAPSLGIPLTIRVAGRDVPPTREALGAAYPGASDALAVFVHGLGETDRAWAYRGVDYGATLQRALGFTPVRVRYNTGRRIARNGTDLAALLRTLVANWPVEVRRLVLVGHSMGGLVLHSALLAEPEAEWRALVSDTVTLGSPHDGAALARWADRLAENTPRDSAFGWLAEIMRSRSAGIRDLGPGTIHDPAWQHTPPVDDVDHIRNHVVVGVAGRADGWWGRIVGDLIVGSDSARGGASPTPRLRVEPDRAAVLGRLNHIGLLGSRRVAAQLIAWLAEP